MTSAETIHAPARTVAAIAADLEVNRKSKVYARPHQLA